VPKRESSPLVDHHDDGVVLLQVISPHLRHPSEVIGSFTEINPLKQKTKSSSHKLNLPQGKKGEETNTHVPTSTTTKKVT
jgi:hypothetical protein